MSRLSGPVADLLTDSVATIPDAPVHAMTSPGPAVSSPAAAPAATVPGVTVVPATTVPDVGVSSTTAAPAATVTNVTVSSTSSIGYTATTYVYPAHEDFRNPTSGWVEVEHFPDSLHHCCVVNIRSMTSARTRAQEVLALQFSQLPSVICVHIGQFAGRGLLQFARVARAPTIEQLLVMHGINATLNRNSTLLTEGFIEVSDDGWGTDSDSMSTPIPTSSLISGGSINQSLARYLRNQPSSSCHLQFGGRPFGPVPKNISECTDTDSDSF